MVDFATSAMRINDRLDIASCVLAMATNERKTLGINRSTLCYERKQLAEEKAVKMSDKTLSKLV